MLRVPGNVSVNQKQSHVESATLPPTMGCALELKQQGTRPFCSHRSVSRDPEVFRSHAETTAPAKF